MIRPQRRFRDRFRRISPGSVAEAGRWWLAGVVGLVAVASGATSAAPAQLDPTCVEGPEVNTGRVVLALRSNGVAQAYFRYVPATYEGVAMPVVVNLHERGSSAIEQVRLSGLDRTAEAHGFVTLTPLGLGDLATWDTGSESADVRFIEKVLDWTAEQLCVDPSRVYATGVGRGGRFATRLADALPGRIVAVKAVDRLPFSAEAVWSYLVDHPLPSEP